MHVCMYTSKSLAHTIVDMCARQSHGIHIDQNTTIFMLQMSKEIMFVPAIVNFALMGSYDQYPMSLVVVPNHQLVAWFLGWLPFCSNMPSPMIDQLGSMHTKPMPPAILTDGRNFMLEASN